MKLLWVVAICLGCQLSLVVLAGALKFRHLTKPTSSITYSSSEWKAVLERVRPKANSSPYYKPIRQNPGAGRLSTQFIRPSVVGGSAAVLGQFPWQVYIDIDGTGACGGSLILPNWVLTAAHCIGTKYSLITLGSVDINNPSAGHVTVNTTDVYKHAAYNATEITNDIALIKLPQNITLTDNIKLVALPSMADANTTFVGTQMNLSGFGKLNDTTSATNLQHTVLTVITQAECVGNYSTVNETNICTFTTGTASCSGDSGGPLVYKDSNGTYKQIGVVSFGAAAGCLVAPSVFMRVTAYLDWMSEIIGQDMSGTAAPTNATEAPTNATTAATNATVAPTNATETPTNATTPATNATVAPTNATETPTNATTPATNATVAPTNATETPTNATTPATNATVAPTNATETPTNATTPATNATVAPTNATEPPTNATTPASNATTTPTNATSAPTNAATPTTASTASAPTTLAPRPVPITKVPTKAPTNCALQNNVATVLKCCESPSKFTYKYNGKDEAHKTCKGSGVLVKLFNAYFLHKQQTTATSNNLTFDTAFKKTYAKDACFINCLLEKKQMLNADGSINPEPLASLLVANQTNPYWIDIVPSIVSECVTTVSENDTTCGKAVGVWENCAKMVKSGLSGQMVKVAKKDSIQKTKKTKTQKNSEAKKADRADTTEAKKAVKAGKSEAKKAVKADKAEKQAAAKPKASAKKEVKAVVKTAKRGKKN